jgi:hypothetical protein
MHGHVEEFRLKRPPHPDRTADAAMASMQEHWHMTDSDNPNLNKDYQLKKIGRQGRNRMK